MTYFKNKNTRENTRSKKINIPINLLPAKSFNCNYRAVLISVTAA